VSALRELLFGQVNRLRYVGRFSTLPVFQRENVAEHSFYTVLYALWLLEHTIATWCMSERLYALCCAAVHDLDESISGDMIRSFKYSDPELATALRHATDRSTLELVRSLAVPDWHDNWRLAKNAGDRIGRLVALADFMSVLSVMASEIRFGNQGMLEEAKSGTLLEYVETFDTADYRGEYGDNLIDELLAITREVLGETV